MKIAMKPQPREAFTWEGDLNRFLKWAKELDLTHTGAFVTAEGRLRVSGARFSYSVARGDLIVALGECGKFVKVTAEEFAINFIVIDEDPQ